MGRLPKCALCDVTSDPRCGVYDRDGNAYALCDGCAPNTNQADVDRVVAKCVARGTPAAFGYPRFWPSESAYALAAAQKGEERG